MPNEDIQPIVILPTFCGETECGRGAEIACRTIYAQITGTVRDGGDLTRITDQDVKNWITASREAIVADAQEHGKRPREYACTILGAVAGNDRVAGNGELSPVPVPAGIRCINALQLRAVPPAVPEIHEPEGEPAGRETRRKSPG